MSEAKLILAELEVEMQRQDAIHPEGFPRTRSGIRLALACAEDEIEEARQAWREARCKCDEPACDHADWSDVRVEMVQAAAVLMRCAGEKR